MRKEGRWSDVERCLKDREGRSGPLGRTGIPNLLCVPQIHISLALFYKPSIESGEV